MIRGAPIGEPKKVQENEARLSKVRGMKTDRRLDDYDMAQTEARRYRPQGGARIHIHDGWQTRNAQAASRGGNILPRTSSTNRIVDDPLLDGDRKGSCGSESRYGYGCLTGGVNTSTGRKPPEGLQAGAGAITGVISGW
jgi:hypothetical protein